MFSARRKGGKAAQIRKMAPLVKASGSSAGPVISTFLDFGNDIQKSFSWGTSAGHLSLHGYQYEIYLENTGANEFRN